MLLLPKIESNCFKKIPFIYLYFIIYFNQIQFKLFLNNDKSSTHMDICYAVPVAKIRLQKNYEFQFGSNIVFLLLYWLEIPI